LYVGLGTESMPPWIRQNYWLGLCEISVPVSCG